VVSIRQAGRAEALAAGRLVSAGRRECAAVARHGARTFYVAFCMLPPRRRHAIHAVYAFSRAADDIADDPALSAVEKRHRLAEHRQRLTEVYSGAPRTPRQAALADAVVSFAIPRAML
jgi:phytoene/squalene synthetase